jgi:hypothetical protein
MSQQQLIALHLRLQRKLSATTSTWHSGRVESLTLALRQVEQALRERRGAAGAAA